MWYSSTLLAAWSSSILLAPSTLPAASLAPSRAAALCQTPVLMLPSSIVLEDGLDQIAHWMLQYSPRFREQCVVLASRLDVRATIRIAIPPPGSRMRARAIVRRDASGTFAADIEIRHPAAMPELLAHELEHVIEQIDGVDLQALAERGEAQRVEGGAFETRRACLIGQQVAGEVADNAPDRVRTAGAAIWRTIRGIITLGSTR
jgi:hypothetical protein